MQSPAIAIPGTITKVLLVCDTSCRWLINGSSSGLTGNIMPMYGFISGVIRQDVPQVDDCANANVA